MAALEAAWPRCAVEADTLTTASVMLASPLRQLQHVTYRAFSIMSILTKLKDWRKRLRGVSIPVVGGGVSWGEDPRGQRIARVVDRYLANVGNDTHFRGLLLAGVCTLQDDAEIREACRCISEHGQPFPIPKAQQAPLQGLDLKHFFTLLNAVFQESRHFNEGSVERAVLQTRKK